MYDYYAHTQGGEAIVIRECSKEGKSFKKGIEAWGSSTAITTPTLETQRKPPTSGPRTTSVSKWFAR
jgi:hypothetical protein